MFSICKRSALWLLGVEANWYAGILPMQSQFKPKYDIIFLPSI